MYRYRYIQKRSSKFYPFFEIFFTQDGETAAIEAKGNEMLFVNIYTEVTPGNHQGNKFGNLIAVIPNS